MATTIGLAQADKSEVSILGLSSTGLYRLLSIVGLFALWEIGGLVPISVAFPTFSATMVAMVQMIADGSMIVAYADTIKPLLIGVGISAGFGVVLGVAMGLNRRFQWFWEPIFIVLQAEQHTALPTLNRALLVFVVPLTVATLVVIVWREIRRRRAASSR